MGALDATIRLVGRHGLRLSPVARVGMDGGGDTGWLESSAQLGFGDIEFKETSRIIV